MLEIGLIFVTLLLVLTIGLSVLHVSRSAADKSTAAPGFQTPEFTPSQMYLDKSGGAGIAINESTKTICLIQGRDLPPRLLTYTDFLGCYLLRNEGMLERAVRTYPPDVAAKSQEMHTQLEDQLKVQQEARPSDSKDQRIDVCLLIDDQQTPVYRVNFLDMDAKEGGVIFDKSMIAAKHWQHLLAGMIGQADQSYKGEPANGTHHGEASVADELMKLRSLLESNTITQADFDTQKDKLLSSS